MILLASPGYAYGYNQKLGW